MSFYGSRLPHFIEGKTEEEVRQKLVAIAAELGQKIEVASIYFNSAKARTVAWYYHDIKAAPLPPTGEVKKKTTKKTKKKTVKKA